MGAMLDFRLSQAEGSPVRNPMPLSVNVWQISLHVLDLAILVRTNVSWTPGE